MSAPRKTRGWGDAPGSESESESDESGSEGATSAGSDRDATLRGDKPEGKKKHRWGRKDKKRKSKDGEGEGKDDVEMGNLQKEAQRQGALSSGIAKALSIGREQRLPDDAVLAKEQADDVRTVLPIVLTHDC